jgi:hypothetical protein
MGRAEVHLGPRPLDGAVDRLGRGEGLVRGLVYWNGFASSWQSVAVAKTFLCAWGSAPQLASVALQDDGFCVSGAFVDHPLAGRPLPPRPW